ncbi:phosphodiester glycosidase family protein [Roseicyclus sp. F158]|uniref:Phosphodiester glycosidase family protein n=1 Tax=Tropicimonas omnivorans TaxID=3075590 RepID=A0ABU3DBI5_9RHOB|nr:phosphodiester glycosidase family protein [Roseicyclus sp. F158]MDT0681068.1 phosphodiester glycosidase family protein [Roseicyclus sp. F158]
MADRPGRRVLLLLGALLVPILFSRGASAEVSCERITFEDAPYTVCRADVGSDDIRVFYSDAKDGIYGGFSSVDTMLAEEGRTLALAMNAGMYHGDRRAVGLLIEDGAEKAPIVTSEGPGNFGLLPNGVFCLTEEGAGVIESRAFAEDPPSCRFATQSGPMLVIDGALHPRFIEGGDSRHIRNGVGVSEDGTTVWFAISDARVNFHDFGRLFRDRLGVPNALYLDGKVSRLHAPSIGRSDPGWRLGPMIGVAVPR